MTPYQLGNQIEAQATVVLRESTRLSVGKWWPEGELALHDDRIEFQSSWHVRRSIPMEKVLGLASRRHMCQRYLELRFSPDSEFSILRFYPRKPGSWFDEFEKQGIAIEDEYGLRTSKGILRSVAAVVKSVEVAIGLVFVGAIVFAFFFS